MYTKGDWTITAYPHEKGLPDVEHFRIGAITPNSDVHIAFVDGNGLEVNRANAQLIASAPNLYKACKLALKMADAIVEQVSGDNIEVLMARATINEALSKAEGKYVY